MLNPTRDIKEDCIVQVEDPKIGDRRYLCSGLWEIYTVNGWILEDRELSGDNVSEL